MEDHVRRAVIRSLNFIMSADLIALKLVAAEEPNRRPSKREHDVADVLALLEEHPELKSPELMTRLQSVRTRLLTAGLDLNAKTSEPGK
jgi:hypothetical protein